MFLEKILYDDYQLTNCFNVYVIEPTNGFNLDLSSKIVSVSIGEDELNFETLKSGKQAFSDIKFNDTFSITLRETTNGTSREYMKAWMWLNYNFVTKQFIAYESMLTKRLVGAWRNIIVEFYSSINGFEKPNYIITFEDCMPKNYFQGGDFNHAESNPVEQTYNFAFQDFHIEQLTF